MSSAIKIAVAGSGYFSHFHYNAWKRMADNGDVELAGICSLDRGEAGHLADRYVIDRVFDDFDAMLDETGAGLVDIVTPPHTHFDLVRAAVDRGIAGDCVYLTNRHVVDHILSGSPAVNSAAEYLANLSIEEAIYASTQNGSRIELKDF
jgi:predicted dehydrogenase